MEANLTRTDRALVSFGGYVSQVYAWMTGGLFLTALITWFIYSQLVSLTPLGVWVLSNSWLVPVVFIAELLVVIALAGFVSKLNTGVAIVLFLAYAIMNGLFFGIVVTAYTPGSVFAAFGATAGTFLIMTLYGYFTKSDLTKFGSLAIMGLIGIILGTIINALLIRSDGFSWLLTYVGIGIFIVLIAYDTQKIKRFAANAEQGGDYSKYAIIGALSLYLDFINVFIRLLAIMGKRR